MRPDNDQDEVKLEIVTPVAAEPVTLTELKTHLRVDLTDDDDLLGVQLQAARELIERYTGHRMMTRVERLWLDSFPSCGIVIPASPVTAVASIKYYGESEADTEGTVVDATTYYVDLKGLCPRIILKTGAVWPQLTSTHRRRNAVAIQFTSGYAAIGSVPATLKTIVKLLAGQMYENREATAPIKIEEVPLGFRYAMAPYRIWEALL